MLLNRTSLKSLFSKGKFPSENHFAHLIDSSVNKMEDGIAKTAADGLQLAPQGDFNQVLSVYERMDLPLPAWQVKLLKENDARGLSFEKVERDANNEPTSFSRLFLADDGKVGINTRQPRFAFQVDAPAALHTRLGTRVGKVPGDGEWHPILSGLKGPAAFEAVARIDGPAGRGKYAFTHAIALATFGGRGARPRIRQTRAYYGWFWNRIEFRWAGTLFDYALEVRTRQHYGFSEDNAPSMICFHLTELWDSNSLHPDQLPLVQTPNPPPPTQ